MEATTRSTVHVIVRTGGLTSRQVPAGGPLPPVTGPAAGPG